MNQSSEQQLLLKQKIEKLINGGFIKEASSVLNKYEHLFREEKWLLTTKSVIHLMNGEIELAEKLLKGGLVKFPFNADILFNLAYLFEQKQDIQSAYDYYLDAEFVLKEKEKEIVKHPIDRLKSLSDDLIKKQKVAVFVKPGLDNFIDDILTGLADDYRVRKILVSSFDQIDQGMEWADICWFEWCDELVIYGSKLQQARNKTLICRLHSYEAFTSFIDQVYWNNIDHVIFVAEHIKQIVIEKTNLPESRSVVIPNGIDMEKYSFKERTHGNKIAYVGYINYKKGPMLLLQTFKQLSNINKDFELYIAGEFQDQRDSLYFQQMIREFRLEDKIFFEGWQDDINKWLEDKHYILSTSLLEGQHLSTMEAMAKGIKPLIHNFVGAKKVYPAKYIWNTIDEVSCLINADYNSFKYRKFIDKNFSLKKEIHSLKQLLKEKAKSVEDKSIFEFNYQESLIKFDLTDLNDHIQKSILYNNKFYELVMLEDAKERISQESIVIDIGANLGNHSVFFGAICKCIVYAFEPHETTFNLLKSNIKLNGLEKKVIPYNLALGSCQARGEMEIDDEKNKGLARVVENDKGKVQIKSLDSILYDQLNRVDLIKIDVEGMEMEVLKGAQSILKKFKPWLYIEAATSKELEDLSSYLSSFGYQIRMRFNATPTYLFSV